MIFFERKKSNLKEKNTPFGNTPLFGALVQIELSQQCLSSLFCLMKENPKEKHAFLMHTSLLSADAYSRALWGVNGALLRVYRVWLFGECIGLF